MTRPVTEAQKRAVRKYDETHTKQLHLKLNLENDRDILDFLEQSGNIQGTIKAALRAMIKEAEKNRDFLQKRC